MNVKEPLTESGLYVHIPFCRHHCGYCAFAVTAKNWNNREIQKQYLDSIFWELDKQKARFPAVDFSTLYIGGGTPSILHDEWIDYLFKHLYERVDGSKLKEITFECNPEDIRERPGIIEQLKSNGVTRLSVGIQTTEYLGQEILERQVKEDTIPWVSEYLDSLEGMSLSYDFILSWPKQSLDSFRKHDLKFLENIIADHLSVYILNYEPGTRLERDRKKGRINPLADSMSSDIWDEFQAFARKLNFHHYEISNFAKVGHKSIHNRNTWRGHAYLGIGSGAVSRIGKVRWKNVVTPSLYTKKIKREVLPAESAEFIDRNISWQEDLMLAMRFEEGLNLELFKQKHQFDPMVCLDGKEKDWYIQGYLNKETLSFTEKGWNLYDDLISDWMLCIEDAIRVH